MSQDFQNRIKFYSGYMFTVTVRVINKLQFLSVMTTLSFIYVVVYICFLCISFPVILLVKKEKEGEKTELFTLVIKMWEQGYMRVIYYCGNWLDTSLVKHWGEKQSFHLKSLQGFFSWFLKCRQKNIIKTTFHTTVVMSGLGNWLCKLIRDQDHLPEGSAK